MKGYKDLLLFGKVLSIAFLVSGYVILGFFAGRKLQEMGYPAWTRAACTIIGAAIGIHQGYHLLKEIIHKIK